MRTTILILLTVWIAASASAQSSILLLRNPFQPFAQQFSASVTSLSNSSNADESIENATVAEATAPLPVLKSIVINSTRSAWALLDNQIVTVSDTVGEYTVVSISLTTVVITDGERMATLSLTPTGRGASSASPDTTSVIPHTGIEAPAQPSNLSGGLSPLMQNLGSIDQVLGPMLEFMYPEGIPLEERQP